MVKISASLLSARDKLKETIEEYNNLNIDYIHLDIMDNEFVHYNSFTYDEIKEIAETSAKPFDVHLMVKDINSYIYNYAMLNTEYITLHYEALIDTKMIDTIKSYNIKCGLSIKPNTEIELLYELLPKIDLVLIMSVEPGKGGQEFIPGTLEKIRKLKYKVIQRNLNVIISVDGGINKLRAQECIANGADMLVIGSALVDSDDKSKYINECTNDTNND